MVVCTRIQHFLWPKIGSESNMNTAHTLYTVLTWLLVAFFLIGAIVNWVAPKKVREDYQRWGYPAWFHYITSVLELGASIFIAIPSFKLYGAALGSLVMLAAAVTVMWQREWQHLVAPVIVLTLSLVLAASEFFS